MGEPMLNLGNVRLAIERMASNDMGVSAAADHRLDRGHCARIEELAASG